MAKDIEHTIVQDGVPVIIWKEAVPDKPAQTQREAIIAALASVTTVAELKTWIQNSLLPNIRLGDGS